MNRKIEIFINSIRQLVTYPFRKWKDFHDKILQLDDRKIQNTELISPQDILFIWIIEVIQYGLLFVFVWNILFGWRGVQSNILLMLMSGIVRWLWLDLVKNTFQAVRE